MKTPSANKRRLHHFNVVKSARARIVKYLINEKTIDKYTFKCYTIIVPRVKQESEETRKFGIHKGCTLCMVLDPLPVSQP